VATRKRTLRVAVAAAAAAGVAVLALLPTQAGARAVDAKRVANSDAPQLAGYQLAWKDDFNGAAGKGVEPGKWIYDTGTGYGCAQCPDQWGTAEIESMSTSTENVSFDGQGNLLITPVRHSDGSWTSGRIETRKEDFTAGDGGLLRVQASIELPQVGSGPGAAGIWPAFWMLGAPFRDNAHTGWPGVGEIDVMENVNGRGTVFSTLHCGDLNEPNAAKPWLLGPCGEFDGIGGTTDVPAASLQGSFHTYTVELDRRVQPNQLRYSFDGGAPFFVINADQVPAQTWTDAVNHGFFIILNVAVGGSFPWAECRFFPHDGGCNTPNADYPQVVTPDTISGKPMKVAYVAVYNKK
jgi:beta-glucanase (GH16 family)